MNKISPPGVDAALAGDGHTIDDTGLRLMLAREAIQVGRLPVRRADRMWGGPSLGVLCAVCGLSITPEELGYELEFAQDGHTSVSHHLHVRCFAAWESECRHAESAGSHNGGGRNGGGNPLDGADTGNGHDTDHRREPGR